MAHMKLTKSDFLGVEPRHKYFLKVYFWFKFVARL